MKKKHVKEKVDPAHTAQFDPRKRILKQALQHMHDIAAEDGHRQTIDGYAYETKLAFNLPMTSKELAEMYRKLMALKGVDIDESLGTINKEDIMKSEVHVQGVGVYSVETIQKNLINKLGDLLEKANSNDPYAFRQIQQLLKHGTLQLMIDSLVDAYDELEATRKKGGSNSKNIPDIFS